MNGIWCRRKCRRGFWRKNGLDAAWWHWHSCSVHLSFNATSIIWLLVPCWTVISPKRCHQPLRGCFTLAASTKSLWLMPNFNRNPSAIWLKSFNRPHLQTLFRAHVHYACFTAMWHEKELTVNIFIMTHSLGYHHIVNTLNIQFYTELLMLCYQSRGTEEKWPKSWPNISQK